MLSQQTPGAAPDTDDDGDEGGSTRDGSPGGPPRRRVRLSVGAPRRGQVPVVLTDEQLRLFDLLEDNGDLKKEVPPSICYFDTET